LIYLFTAAILGILITVVPLIIIAPAEIASNTQRATPATTFGRSLAQLDGQSNSAGITINNKDLTILAIAFIVALAAFGLAPHRAPRRFDMRLGVPPI
jgi:hypothetical protein